MPKRHQNAPKGMFDFSNDPDDPFDEYTGDYAAMMKNADIDHSIRGVQHSDYISKLDHSVEIQSSPWGFRAEEETPVEGRLEDVDWQKGDEVTVRIRNYELSGTVSEVNDDNAATIQVPDAPIRVDIDCGTFDEVDAAEVKAELYVSMYSVHKSPIYGLHVH